MASNDDEPPPTALPANPPSPEPVYPAIQVLLPNLNRVSSATFRRGSISRRRVNIALGMLLAIAALATMLVIFGDLVFANPDTVLVGAFVAALVVGVVGLVLIRRDEQRARRARRGRPANPTSSTTTTITDEH
ncbi:hypothetical protein [Mycetocola zhujimingii]|uniref:hypothetical protein n=1 Tax=Mycetocola zhujimingii TaxID=2079792 RepID=UPI000D39ED15|nr:hypothetical protein [Mycetocola zhujimingii]AWB86005.1 hypothetical protein C3E77_04840 [Mycetocola zhujimingii]